MEISIRRRMRLGLLVAVAAAMLAVPSIASATAYQYFYGTLYAGAEANSQNGYSYRRDNNVKRPCSTQYQLTFFYSDGTPYYRRYNSSTCTYTLPDPYDTYPKSSIAQCGNASSGNHINVSCWWNSRDLPG